VPPHAQPLRSLAALHQDRLLPCLLQELFDVLHQGGLGHCANDGLHLLAVLEDHDGGDAADAVLGGHAGALVRVQLVLQQGGGRGQGSAGVLLQQQELGAITSGAADHQLRLQRPLWAGLHSGMCDGHR
jgi:hypothetical protein